MATYRQLSLKNFTLLRFGITPWWHDSNKTASGNPGAVHYFSFLDGVAEQRSLPATGILGATSADGTNFLQHPELSLNQQGTFDTDSVETCDVVIVEDPLRPGAKQFRMYYSGSSSNGTDKQFFIALARSSDGVTFSPLPASQSRDNTPGLLFGVSEALGASGDFGNFVTDPTVVVRNGTYHMWTLCIQGVPTPNGGVCYHTSSDGIDWQHHGLVSGLNRGFPIQPSVYFNPLASRFEMIVVMDTPTEEASIHDPPTNLSLRVTGFFFATSEDGRTWTEASPNTRVLAEDLTQPFENRGLATAADAVYRGGVVNLFYPSLTTQNGSPPGLGTLLNWPLNLAQRKAADLR